MAGKININAANYAASTALNNKPGNFFGKQARAYAEGYRFVKGGGVYTTPYPNATYGGLDTDNKSAAYAWKQGCADAQAGRAAPWVGAG